MNLLGIFTSLAFIATAGIFLPVASAGRKYPIGRGCEGRSSGDTYNCHCKTGTNDMDDDTVVFNQCSLGKNRGAEHGETEVTSDLVTNMGLAVYSGKSTDICGGSDRRCKCTCFNMDDVNGPGGFRTSSSKKKNKPGKDTKCLGLCGANCEAGNDGKRYASILIHDVCQSWIRSSEAWSPIPNNDCWDEGSHAIGAAALSLFANGSCPAK